jgi:hypothetical protein
MGDSPTQPSTRISSLFSDEGEEPRQAMSGPQFTLGQMMKVIAGVGVVLAIVIQQPDSIAPIFFHVLIFAACLYGLAKLPLRIRLTIEILTACLLLVLSAWVWRPPFYVTQADRTEKLARLCSIMADETDDGRSKALFRREAVWYRRQAFVLRLQAMWYGLIRSMTKENPVALSDRELILELGTMEAMDRHERIAEETGIGTKNGASGSLY